MFEMQVRCVWVILNNQVRVNFSTNCKCRHIYLSFSDHQIPSVRLPQSAGNGISETLDFKISRGSMPPHPPRNLTPSLLDFRAFGAGKLVTKIPTSTPEHHTLHEATRQISRQIEFYITVYIY